MCNNSMNKGIYTQDVKYDVKNINMRESEYKNRMFLE